MKHLPQTLVDQMTRMRSQGHTIQEIMAATGKQYSTVRCRVDPVYREKTNERVSRKRRLVSDETLQVVMARDNLVTDHGPDPNRDILGDPPPGRSALDVKLRERQEKIHHVE